MIRSILSVGSLGLIALGCGSSSSSSPDAAPIDEVIDAAGIDAMQVIPDETKIVAADGFDGQGFGAAVAIDGDTMVVGAVGDTSDDIGAAYVYLRSGGSWTEQAKLTVSAVGDTFGTSVSIDGDSIIVGAFFHDGAVLDAGAAYVFVREGTTWTEQGKLEADDAFSSDFFGWSVSIDGDTALIGARQEDDKGGNAGAAYVFVRSGTTWTQQQKLLSDDSATGDGFGTAVAVSGDSALIGAPRNDNSGSAYIFLRSGTTWTEQQELVVTPTAGGDNFGGNVSLEGDTALVSAHAEEESGGTNTGSAYVFARSGTTWAEQGKLLAGDASDGSFFGIGVSLSADIAVIGANGDARPGGDNSGAAYVFSRTGTTWSEDGKLSASDAAADTYFGSATAVDGMTVVIGAPSPLAKGAVYVMATSAAE
jgi:hypothetical protein